MGCALDSWAGAEGELSAAACPGARSSEDPAPSREGAVVPLLPSVPIVDACAANRLALLDARLRSTCSAQRPHFRKNIYTKQLCP